MLTSDQEKAEYLANILVVALADRSLSVRETAALEEVRKGIDAKKGVLSAARKAVEGSPYSFVRAGTFADCVKNLEDMLFVALTDDDLDDNEAALVKEFSRLAGISEAQFDYMVTETSCAAPFNCGQVVSCF